MKLLSKVIVVVAAVALVTGWANAASVLEGEKYAYTTIPTDDVPEVHTGCAEFESEGVRLLSVDWTTEVFDGSWRARQFRGITLYRAVVGIDYMGIPLHIHTLGMQPRAGILVGGSNVYDASGDKWFVMWTGLEDNACDLDPPTP